MSGSFSSGSFSFERNLSEKRSETSLKEFSGIGYTVQLSRIGAVCLRQLVNDITHLKDCQALFQKVFISFFKCL